MSKSIEIIRRADDSEGRNLLDRMLNTQNIERVVPRLQPDLLHRIIQICGLEDCSELVALTTPEQLERIFDLDLWRAAEPGLDEQFDADRFGVWIEVLLQSGAAAAAHKLAGIDADLVIAGLAQHMLVFDRAAVSGYEMLEGKRVAPVRTFDDALFVEMSGMILEAKRPDSWEAIIEVLLALDAGHPAYFHRVMAGCRAQSSSGFEFDELHDLLSQGQQVMFDLAVGREGRREKQGFVTPAQARAFLKMARQMHLNGDAPPLANPLARAYFRSIEKSTATEIPHEPGLLGAESTKSDHTDEPVAAVYDILLEAGVFAPPRALLVASAQDQSPRPSLLQAHMQYVLDLDQSVFSRRSEELIYLANTLMAGSSVQKRPFAAPESLDAAVAVCNLGLENWPAAWLPAAAQTPPESFLPESFLPESFLIDHDLISVFQVGWTVLHRNVSMYAAEQLIIVLKNMRCADREIQLDLDRLRITMLKHWRAGEPWRACDALDVIASLDTLAWFILLALIAEFPVLHAGIGAAKDTRIHSVNASDFEFISENRQIDAVHEFMRTLSDTLSG